MMSEKTFKVVEIFRSIQGEGANAGKQATFIRLAHCNLDCWFCDTDWSKGERMTLTELMEEVERLGCKFIIWTGGEPTMQLDEKTVAIFKGKGFYQAIETNGTKIPPKGLDYITCSPKVSLDVIKRVFQGVEVGEFRYPYGEGEEMPPAIDDLPPAKYYFLSPLFLGEEKKRFEYAPENVDACLKIMANEPRWRLSLQVHKILNLR